MDQKKVEIPISRPRPIPRLKNGLNRDRVRDRDHLNEPRPRLLVRDRESRQCLLCYNLWRVIAMASPLHIKLGVVWCQNCHITYLQRLRSYSYSASMKNSLCRWDLHYFSLVDLDTQNGTNYCWVTKIETTPNAWLNNFKKKNTMLETLANYLKCMSRHKATFLRAVLNMI